MQTMFPAWKRRLLTGMACACTMLTFLNMGCITAATPDLSGTFVVGTLDVSWSGAACPLGTALSFTVAAYLWARIGLRRSLRTALLIMLAGTLLGLAADHFFLMIAARFLQGAGGGLALVYGTGLVNAALPPERRGVAMGVKLCSIGLASCASPVVGCLLVQYWHWRGLFVIVGAAAAVLAVLTTLYVPNQKIPKGGKFDWFSFLAVGMGCVCMLMVLIYGETDGWTAPGVLAWMYGGFCSFALAFISCMTHRTPLLDVRVLGNWRFLCGLLASLCNIFCICWVRVGTVQFMRNVMNYEPVGIAYVFMVLVAGFCGGAALVLPLMQKGRLAPAGGHDGGAAGAGRLRLLPVPAGRGLLLAGRGVAPGAVRNRLCFLFEYGYAACPERGGGAFRRRFLPDAEHRALHLYFPVRQQCEHGIGPYENGVPLQHGGTGKGRFPGNGAYA